ncbi:MAG TPA: ABC transporter substrate-binding protein [Candidatus Acidoferrales bacterium]|nr:ABC transporter substrate-binding protein [Candidatus Acidoferrales bacterium]
MPAFVRMIVFNADAATSIARQRGLFAAQGVEVEVAVTPNSTAQMRGLGAGKYDIASTAFDNVLAWSGREKAEMIAVAQAAAAILLPVYVRPEIRDWSDLRRKPLAVDAVDTAYALVLRRILLTQGLDLRNNDYELVPTGATAHRLASMKRGETFAAILNPPWDQEAEAAGMVRFGDHRAALPDYPGGVLAVARAWAEKEPELLVRFLRAWESAAAWARRVENRAEAIRLIAADQSLSSSAAAGRLANLPPTSELNLRGLETVLKLRVEFGFSPPLGTDLSRFYDQQYLSRALAAKP